MVNANEEEGIEIDFNNRSIKGKCKVKDFKRQIEKVKEILATHEVPRLPDSANKELAAIIEKIDKPMWGGESKVH